jgi:two-component system response regulator AtoC
MSTALTDDQLERTATAPTSTRDAGPKPSIAIVDDDSAFASYLRTYLSLRGYESRCYGRGDELLAALKQGETPDAILLDVMMPGMDGMSTLRSLRATQPDAQVIMLSGRNQASIIVEAVQAGATDYVVKPDDPEGLGEVALDVAIKNAIEKNRLVSELRELRQQVSDKEDQAVWGASDGMRRITTVIEQVGDSDVAVLLRGESGVGKELVSRTLHQQSTRRSQPFVKVNCAALPAELLESELFGHEKGAFTGAATTRIGKFEQADRGTLMLDEIGELPLALQAKLLHVLQDGEFTRLGSNKRVQVDVRIVAATNRDLEKMMTAGTFREDLYYRLRVIELTVPPLRERRDEIPTLVESFILRYARKYRRPAPRLSANLRQQFMEYDWPGNIRELENMIKRLVILQDEQIAVAEIERSRRRGPDVAASMPTDVSPTTPPVVTDSAASSEPSDATEPATDTIPSAVAVDTSSGSLASVARAAALTAERALITQTLNQVHWNRRKASQILGVSYKTLLNKIKECAITRD